MAETDASASRDALVERLFGATLGAMDVVSVYIGVRLGLYRALADRGASSSEELAETTGLNERWRFYRYDPGQQFDWHFDGAYERSPLERRHGRR